MYSAGLFTIAKIWKQPKCPSVHEWIKTLWNTVCPQVHWFSIMDSTTFIPCLIEFEGGIWGYRGKTVFIVLCHCICNLNILDFYMYGGPGTNLAGMLKGDCIYTVKYRVLTHSIMSDFFNSMSYSPAGSFVHGILQASILEWVAIPFSRGSS